MRELTKATPKPMLVIAGKTLIEHKLDALPPSIDEVVILVGYMGNQIVEYFGDAYKGKRIRYVYTDRLEGTAQGLWETRHLLDGKFLVMMGDDLYSAKDIHSCLSHDWAVLVEKVVAPKRGARVHVDGRGSIKSIEENTTLDVGMYNNAGLYVLGTDIFNYPLVRIPSGEYGLPQTLIQLATKHALSVVEATEWHQVTAPEDLVRLEALFSDHGAESYR